MSMIRLALTLLALAAVASAVKYTDCGSSGTVTDVEIGGCEGDEDVCILQKGSETTASVTFEAMNETQIVNASLSISILGRPIKLPLEQPDACQAGVSCPVSAGDTNTYSDQFKVPPISSPFTLQAIFQLMDDMGDDIVCIAIPTKTE